MAIANNVLVLLVLILNVVFMLLEIYFWQKPIGLKVFRNTAEQARITSKLAFNQGLYNGFIVGAISVSKRIFYFQAVPAILALTTIYLQ